MLLNNLGKRILICDESVETEFLPMLSNGNGKVQFLTYRNIDFRLGMQTVVPEEGADYDYVLKYYGNRYVADSIAECPCIIANTSMRRQELMDILQWLPTLKKRCYLVLRDLTGHGLDKRYLNQHYREWMIGFQKVYEVPLDYIDKDYQVELDYNGVIQLRHLSRAYCKVIVDFVRQLTDHSLKEVERAFRMVKEGKIFDSRILE